MTLPLGLIDLLPMRTGRIVLRPLELSDLPQVAAMLGDPEVMRFFPRPMSREEVEVWLRRTRDRYRENGTGLFAVTRPEGRGEVFLGDCGVQVRPLGGRPRAEIGYHFARHAWGQGYATEAARACADVLFRATDVGELLALVRPENTRSQQVVRRIGMRPGGAALHAGSVHDVWRLARKAP